MELNSVQKQFVEKFFQDKTKKSLSSLLIFPIVIIVTTAIGFFMLADDTEVLNKYKLFFESTKRVDGQVVSSYQDRSCEISGKHSRKKCFRTTISYFVGDKEYKVKYPFNIDYPLDDGSNLEIIYSVENPYIFTVKGYKSNNFWGPIVIFGFDIVFLLCSILVIRDYFASKNMANGFEILEDNQNNLNENILNKIVDSYVGSSHTICGYTEGNTNYPCYSTLSVLDLSKVSTTSSLILICFFLPLKTYLNLILYFF